MIPHQKSIETNKPFSPTLDQLRLDNTLNIESGFNVLPLVFPIWMRIQTVQQKEQSHMHTTSRHPHLTLQLQLQPPTLTVYMNTLLTYVQDDIYTNPLHSLHVVLD